jgi:succinoglycan biosynthesis protein ExoA
LFNTDLWPGEDPEMFDRIKRHFKIAFNPTTIIYHRRRPTLKGLCKQIYNYGKVRQKKEKILGQTASPVFYIPAIFTLYLLSLPLTLLLSNLFIAPIIIYLIAIIGNGIHIAFKEKSPLSLILVPIINLFIHISYGLGIIAYFFDR